MEDNSVLNFFYDVPNDAYYYEAVKWAAENGITGGVGNSLFAPNQPCNRAQIVTFLWRAAGSPVVNYLMPFTDVDEGAYYAEAVRWAASTGIVTGLTETTFGTDSVCTRAQAAAMIYRCAQAQGKGFTGAWMFHLPFTDVPEWAYESVAWCYMNSVTTGVSETSFAPGNDCTRAQIVTFLWRAAGSPAPKRISSFTDVPADAFYAKAVAWAVENGITSGTGESKFSPNATCTRAQAVTFLYRASGSPAVSGGSAFSDVAANAYYADAVAWAEKNGVTGGIGGGLFGSGNTCTRAQIVTFLYRAYQGK